MRNAYMKKLTQLSDLLTQMGALIEEAIALAIRALEEQNVEFAAKAVAYDPEIDNKERDIESLCLQLLLHQQPVAGDLRLISAALQMVHDMERIGDHAADIAEITIHMAGAPYADKLAHIPQMAEVTAGMVTQAVDAFVKRDLALAGAVIERDDEVDALFVRTRADLIDLFRADNANGDQAFDLMMAAKYFEKIGDHAENIAEWVVFAITGEHKRVSWESE
ncbi:MAG: phosphate signaling complex protein PhoU [Oscillospiraceae bacterium]|nr:phosphate signaling complex protein PhoU [Oscillospiraceae bacterium]